MSNECENCIKRKTMWCPTSIDCMALDELPYYLDKISALEKIDKLEQENKQLKEMLGIEELTKTIQIKYSLFRDLAMATEKSNNLNSILTEFEKTLNSYDIEYLHTMNEHLLADNIENLKDILQELKEKYK